MFNEYNVFVRSCAKVRESICSCRVYILDGHTLYCFIHHGRGRMLTRAGQESKVE